jgi:hypothetical protein
MVRIFVLFQVLLVACAGRQPPAPIEAPTPVEEATVPAEETPQVVFLHERGLGPWRLGMSRFDVLQYGSCSRFEPVRVTGGFECPFWEGPLGKQKISFVFNEDYRLEKIQLWLFEGPRVPEDQGDWAAATWKALQEIQGEHLLSSVTHASFLALDREGFVEAMVRGRQETMPFSLHFDVDADPAGGPRTWISVIASPHGYYSFLFVAN